MPTGIGSRKVLTPRSVKVPRRSLPPQSKLLEAVSFESLNDDNYHQQPSSPDIMTTKLQEKIKNNKIKEKEKEKDKLKANAGNNNYNNSFNQRLNAAASLSANSGRSKLSTEEFRADDDDDDVVEGTGNDIHKGKDKQKDSRVIHEASIARESRNLKDNTNGFKSSNSHANNNKSINSVQTNTYKATETNYSVPYVQLTTNPNSNNFTSQNNNYNNSFSKANSSSSSNSSSYNPNYNSNFNTMPQNSSIPNNYNNAYNYSNNSFDRWNSSSHSIPVGTSDSMISIELLQDQISHLKKEYEGLKQRFTELSRLRLSDPEEHLSEHLKLCEIRDRAGENSIIALKQENEELRRQLKDRAVAKDVLESKSNTDNEETLYQDQQDIENDDKSLMDQVEKVLKIYSNFTGLKITPTPTHWHCEFSSSRRQGTLTKSNFNFKLIYEKELNRYQYLPILDNEDQDKVQLPPFLASDILITSDQMQIFFWRLLDTLTKLTN